MSRTGRVHPDAHRLLRLLPSDRWATTEELIEDARDAGLPVRPGDRGDVMLGPVVFTSALRNLRRQGWAVYQRHTDPPAWRRTPTGTTAADNPQPAPTPKEPRP